MKKLFTCLLVVLTTVAYTQKNLSPETRVLLRDTVPEVGVTNSYIAIDLIEKDGQLTFNYLFLQKGNGSSERGKYKLMTRATLDSFIAIKRGALKVPYLKLNDEELESGNIVNLVSMFSSVIKRRNSQEDKEKKNLLNLCVIRIGQEIDGTRQGIKKYGVKN